MYREGVRWRRWCNGHFLILSRRDVKYCKVLNYFVNFEIFLQVLSNFCNFLNYFCENFSDFSNSKMIWL